MTDKCDVCIGRGQHPEDGTYMLEYDGQQIWLCNAHTQQLLEDHEDLEKKGGMIQEMFGR